MQPLAFGQQDMPVYDVLHKVYEQQGESIEKGGDLNDMYAAPIKKSTLAKRPRIAEVEDVRMYGDVNETAEMAAATELAMARSMAPARGIEQLAAAFAAGKAAAMAAEEEDVRMYGTRIYVNETAEMAAATELAMARQTVRDTAARAAEAAAVTETAAAAAKAAALRRQPPSPPPPPSPSERDQIINFFVEHHGYRPQPRRRHSPPIS